MIDLAVDDLRLAGAAQAVAAGMREKDAGPQAGIENGPPFGDLDRLAERLDRQSMRGHIALLSRILSRQALSSLSSPSP